MANPPLDFELESSSGGTRSLQALRGRVVVLFWEDRERQRQNTALKRELGRFAGDPTITRAVSVVAVADLSAYDFAPARGISRAAIGLIAPAVGIEILLDWRQTLGSPPFSLNAGRSNVMVIDSAGREVLRREGQLDATQRAEIIDAVRVLLAR